MLRELVESAGSIMRAVVRKQLCGSGSEQYTGMLNTFEDL